MPTCAHDSTRDPETMTIGERRAEVASMLARGMVRAVCDARARAPHSAGIPAEPAPSGLDPAPARSTLESKQV